MLTKKHFEAIANILKGEIECPDAPGVLVGEFADYFETQNPNFDREKFVEACGLEV